jgi:archaetidylinositol phosphate synthase
MNNTWSHAAARTLVRPLVGTWVKPNHITLLRLVTGVMACLLLARGGGTAELWSGVLWLISAFLDRADGELARIGNMQSRRGHLYDYYTDVTLNSGFFLAAGFNLRDGWLGHWAILAGSWGFQVDDALYLLPLFVWAHWLAPMLLVAAVVTTVIAVIILIRYLLQLRRPAVSRTQ